MSVLIAACLLSKWFCNTNSRWDQHHPMCEMSPANLKYTEVILVIVSPWSISEVLPLHQPHQLCPTSSPTSINVTISDRFGTKHNTAWFLGLDSYQNLYFFVIILLPASETLQSHHTNNRFQTQIQDPRNSAAFATMGSCASSRKLLQPQVFAALSADFRGWSYGASGSVLWSLKHPGRCKNGTGVNTPLGN